QYQIGLILGCHCYAGGSVLRLEELVTSPTHQVAKELPDVLGILDHQDDLAHAAASTRSLTVTGMVIQKVDPAPSIESTPIAPPCISTIRFEMASPSPVPPFFRVLLSSTC